MYLIFIDPYFRLLISKVNVEAPEKSIEKMVWMSEFVAETIWDLSQIYAQNQMWSTADCTQSNFAQLQFLLQILKLCWKI